MPYGALGNVAVTFAAALYERTLIPAWVTAFGRVVGAAASAIPSPQKQMPVQEFFRLTVTVSVWTTVVLGGMFVAALAFASREQTRAHTG